MENCIYCDKPIPEYKRRYGAYYCSRTCQAKRASDNYHKRNLKQSMPTGTVGAVSELLVACDLLKKGYEVFRSVSPACSCDLAILKNHKLIRVEVKTGYYTVGGKIKAAPKSTGDFDICAIVVPDKIVYEPKLPMNEVGIVVEREGEIK